MVSAASKWDAPRSRTGSQCASWPKTSCRSRRPSATGGLGERPRANPATGIDAYVWIKPPGESDGSSQLIENDEGKGFDRMCDPTYGGNARNGNNASGALANSPLSGHWFPSQFQQLMANAFPPL